MGNFYKTSMWFSLPPKRTTRQTLSNDPFFACYLDLGFITLKLIYVTEWTICNLCFWCGMTDTRVGSSQLLPGQS